MRRGVPAGQFAIVKDVQRDLVVGSGTFDECVEEAHTMNQIYQTDAYVAKLWKAGVHDGS